MPIFKSLRLCCGTTTLAVLFLDCCVMELGYGSARVVSGLPAEAQLCFSRQVHLQTKSIKFIKRRGCVYSTFYECFTVGLKVTLLG